MLSQTFVAYSPDFDPHGALTAFLVIAGIATVAVVAGKIIEGYQEGQREAREAKLPPLGQCPDCGGVASRKAFTCPHCGRPFRAVQQSAPQQPSTASGVFWGLFLFFIVLPLVLWFTCISGILTSSSR